MLYEGILKLGLWTSPAFLLYFKLHTGRPVALGRGERERFIFRRLSPVVGIWRLPQVQHVDPYTGRLS